MSTRTLTSLPQELLIQIIVSIDPFYHIFFLSHTSSGIRSFIKGNAAEICNRVIKTKYPSQLAFLKPQIVDGWLVPTHVDLSMQEQRHKFCARLGFDMPADWNFPVQLTMEDPPKPGPVFLHLIDVIVIKCSPGHPRWGDRRDDSEEEKVEKDKGKGEDEERDDRKVVLDYKVYCEVNGLDTYFTHPTDPKPTRRALVWYYGVPEGSLSRVSRGSTTRGE